MNNEFFYNSTEKLKIDLNPLNQAFFVGTYYKNLSGKGSKPKHLPYFDIGISDRFLFLYVLFEKEFSVWTCPLDYKATDKTIQTTKYKNRTFIGPKSAWHRRDIFTTDLQVPFSILQNKHYSYLVSHDKKVYRLSRQKLVEVTSLGTDVAYAIQNNDMSEFWFFDKTHTSKTSLFIGAKVAKEAPEKQRS
jgi:hypothetical protein